MTESKINLWAVGCLILFLIGLALGLFLVQRSQIFKSKASVTPIIFEDKNGQALALNNQGVPFTSDKQVVVILTSPLGPADPSASNPISAPNSVYTVGFRISDDPALLTLQPFLSYQVVPTSQIFQFPASAVGDKFIFVDFKDSLGDVKQYSAKINLLAGKTRASDVPQYLQITDPAGSPIPCDLTVNPPVCQTKTLNLKVKIGSSPATP